MNREISRGACALLSLSLAACQTMPVADGAAEAAKIRALDASWNEAVAGGDAAKMASFYSEDAVFMPPNEESMAGDAIRKSWSDMAGLPKVRLRFAPSRIEVDNDGAMAIDVGTYEFSFDSPAGPVQDHGKYVQVWEKKNGVWKCAVDIYNSSVPLPPPPAPAAAAAPATKPAAKHALAKKHKKK